MNKMSTNASRLLYDNVVANDVLSVHRSINNFAISSKEIIDLENRLMINSFYKNKPLFDSKYLYYRLSIVLKDISLFIDKEQLEKIFTYLLDKSTNCLGNASLDDLSKIGQLNELYLNSFYRNFIDQSVTDEDVIKVYQGINSNNQAFSEIVTLENKILRNSIQKSPAIYANKLAYYKLAMQIKGIGLKLNNEEQANDIFNKMFEYASFILDMPNIDSYTKLNILDFLYFKCAQLDFSYNKSFSHQLSIINKEIKALSKQLTKIPVEEKEESHVYSIKKQTCLV